MTDKLKQLILLLRSHLFRENIGPSFPDLSTEEWDELFHLALSHGVADFCYEGAYHSGIIIPEPLRHAWRQNMLETIESYLTLQSECLTIIKTLKENHINPIILKGFSVSELYPCPMLRKMFDIDIFITKNFYDAALILESLGYKAKKEVAIHHIEFVKDNILVELHHTLFTPIGNKEYDEMIKLMAFTGEKPRTMVLHGNAFPILPEADFINESFGHILKHLIHDRLVLRNICDILLLLKTAGKNEFIDLYTRNIDNDLGWYLKGINSLLVHEFGLSPERTAGIPLLSRIESETFTADMFAVSSGLTGINKYYSSLKLGGRFKMLFYYIKAAGRGILIRYPYCRKTILLRPVAFIHAYFDYFAEFMGKVIRWRKYAK